MNEINGVNIPFIPAGGLKELERQPINTGTNERNSTFSEIFEKELNEIKFSAHAKARIASRELTLTDNDINRIQSAVNIAGSKGAVESLVLLDERAFIVSVPNRTVITVVNTKGMENNVITNIDSAVFA